MHFVLNKSACTIAKRAGSTIPLTMSKIGFYSQVFEPTGFAETYAEMDKNIKNTISHRFPSLILSFFLSFLFAIISIF
jgi:inosine/xanthosine triphosphate pyrophosphatase family protein